MNLIDFRGGYATDLTDSLMPDNMLNVASNAQWRGYLKKRSGISKYSATDLSSFVGMKGGIRAKLNSTWYTIVALDDDSYVHFYSATTTSLTVIDADYHFTKGKNVEFAYLDGYVVAVNGTDKPAAIYYSGALVIDDLEALDVRTRDESSWWAGQYTDGTTTYTDDTTED